MKIHTHVVVDVVDVAFVVHQVFVVALKSKVESKRGETSIV